MKQGAQNWVENHEQSSKKQFIFRGLYKSVFLQKNGSCANLGPKVRFWADLRFFWGPEMALGISLGAPKVGQRSSSLSWTVQINRNRSRPGADRVRFGIDLAPRTYFSRWFLVDFGMVFGNFGRMFDEFWKDVRWILEGFSMIFYICLERFHWHIH